MRAISKLTEFIFVNSQFVVFFRFQSGKELLHLSWDEFMIVKLYLNCLITQGEAYAKLVFPYRFLWLHYSWRVGNITIIHEVYMQQLTRKMEFEFMTDAVFITKFCILIVELNQGSCKISSKKKKINIARWIQKAHA